MVLFNDTFDYCLMNVLPKNKKLFRSKRAWVEAYWPTTLEIVHYSSKLYAESLANSRDVDIDKIDIFSVENSIYTVSGKQAAKLFSGKSKRELKKYCKTLNKDSVVSVSAEISSRFKDLKSNFLIQEYGEYDGNEVYQAIQDSLKVKP